MSNSIDERVVKMKFDNAQFGSGVSSSLGWLAKLKAALKLDGASKGLEQVSATANKFSTAGAQNQVGALGAKFTALQTVAVAALATIASKAAMAGLSLAKSLTIDPIISGFHEYETQLGAIQTILANTGLKGQAGLKRVNDTLSDLNHYADKTIYNFTEMTRNIGTFTAAGVNLKTSAQAIKGIANLAAISGSNSQQASTAMYQLSQSLAAGKVSLEDWNSVVNAGLGGKVFQNAIIETAKVHGVAVDDIIKRNGSFRNSLQEGWITSKILTETLSKFTGELTAAQLKSMGYTDQQIKGILEMGKTAVDAATKVKTITQLMDTLREAVGSGWSQTFQILFGNFTEAQELFTSVSNTLGGMISDSAKARNELLQGWKDLGGRQALIDGISNAFQALLSFLRPVKDAFREIFPKTTAKQLYDMTVSFRDFMERLKLGAETANNLRRTFAGFFAILGIGWELLKAGVKFIFDLIGAITGGNGSFLEFTGSVGDWLVALHKAIKDGAVFTKFFGILGKILSVPIKLLHLLGDLLSHLFSGLNADGATAGVKKLSDSLNPLQRIGEAISYIWDRILALFDKIATKLGPFGQKLAGWASNVGKAISDAFQNMNFDNVLGAINTGLFAALVALLKKFVSSIGNFQLDGGFLDGIKDAIGGLTGALEGMQNALNATALLLIAAAIGVLTLSFIALSKIDSDGVKRASFAIAIMFGQLGIAFKAFAAISTGASAVKVGVMSAGLILLATAVRILAGAVAKLAGIPIEQLRKGLIALALLLATLVTAANRLNTTAGGMIRTAAGITILAVGIRLLVLSVKALGEMDWQSIAKGLVGVGGLLASLVLFTKFVQADKAGLTQGLGIILLATGLKILASAVQDFTKFNWEQLARGMAGVAAGLGIMVAALNLLPANTVFKATGILILSTSLSMIAAAVGQMSGLSWVEIAKGITTLAAALIVIAGALRLIPNGAVFSAASILIVSTSLQMLYSALSNMGGMSWEEIAKGLTVLAASLIIITAALKIASGSISGSIAITIMAAALNLMVPVLTALGEMSWEEIIKGLAALAGVFLVVGAAGLLLGPLAPVIFALAAGIALLGVAVLAAGIGVLAFATGLTVLAAAGTGAVTAIVGIVAGLVGLIPYVMQQIALGLVAFAKVIAVSGPAILAAITTVLNAFLDSIIQATPRIVRALVNMLTQLLQQLANAVPKMVAAGVKIIVGVLRGIADHIGEVVDQGVRVVVNFINGIARNIGKVVQAGVDFVFKFIHAIADAIRNSGEKLVDAGWDIATAIIEGLIRGIAALVKKAIDAIVDMARSMWNGIKDFFSIFSPSKKMKWLGKQLVLGVAIGLDEHAHVAANSAVAMGEGVMDGVTKTLDGLGKVLGSELGEFNPTITPVLDLTTVKKDATEISRILGMPAMDVASAAAANAAAGFEENRTNAGDSGSDDRPGDTYNYEQNNYSPKALSPVEIYRQTNNLISRKKGGSNANQS